MQTLLKNLRISTRGAGVGVDGRLTAPIAAALGVPAAAVADYRILARSVDSRRGTPVLIYTVAAEVTPPPGRKIPPLTAAELAALAPAGLELPESRLRHPVVVGTGPAGIFGALALALAGVRPVIVDRGPEVEERCAGQRRFLESRCLDSENNLLIGEGGAGTFSDGKLYTGTRDVRGRFVIEELVRCGAPAEIAYVNRPHVGSDRLVAVTARLRRRIEALGGEFHFNTEIADVVVRSGRCAGVRCASGEVLEAPAVLMAPGLGGRELVRRLTGRAQWRLKPFQIGCRIEHPQRFIDRLQYHGSRPEALGAAEYHLVSHPGDGRLGVSSFCMCPGGEIVNASAWPGHSLTNGMSNFARDGEFANSCLIATLPPERFTALEEADRLIESLETETFRLGGGDYTLPAQDAAAFVAGRLRLTGGKRSVQAGVTPGRIDELIPTELREALRAALVYFNRRCPGFIDRGRVIGVESCVSSPVGFVRRATGDSTLPGLFLAGEGVGAAGGIVSAACDGLRCAENLLREG